MFGTLAHLMPAHPVGSKPPKDVPPPTPINFPHCHPRVQEDGRPRSSPSQPQKPLTALLQSIIRPTEITLTHLEALGVNVTQDAPAADLIPDPSYIPDFATWDGLSQEEARDANETSRRPLNNGNLSPGTLTYVDRRRELYIQNDAAFRAVRRMQPPPGKTQVRLGNSFEFFRNLEAFASFWDDTSVPKAASTSTPSDSPEDEKGVGRSSTSDDGSDSEKTAQEGPIFFRTGSGNQMPPEYRLNLITAFLKLVAYDFGCNVSAPRTEPRLYITAPSSTSAAPQPTPPGSSTRSSYFSSGCTFIFRTPTTREAARSGIVEGPLAAVSARHFTNFPQPPDDPSSTATDTDSLIDLARELVAGLITAQHRAREGKTEKRVGEDAWWATKPRWGGGAGGPIGREVDYKEGDDIGDKDEVRSKDDMQRQPPLPAPSSSSSRGRDKGPAAKKARKNLAIYDNYRMVRPPSASWDKKTRYTAVGRARGAEWDDIFVVSALFHHVSILRVRVPDRLLEVLDGAPDDGGRRSWGRVDVTRSRWFDFFKAEERIEAMQLVWSMMAYLMRKEPEEPVDANMEDA
ncbi:system b protein [Pleurostoma richardsiae]|uniref:System b protein n=1 Tax=Pleurostoma richardsiae TaxID=41990 RepID=A0AA38VMC8_9PEZI|nr:system b protein [Pleurostoma richardsiae]